MFLHLKRGINYRSRSSPSILWCDLRFFCCCDGSRWRRCFSWYRCKWPIRLGWCFCLCRYWTVKYKNDRMKEREKSKFEYIQNHMRRIELTYVGNTSADLPRTSLPINTSGNSSLVIVSIVWYSVVSIEYKLIAPSTRSSYRCCVHIGSIGFLAFSMMSRELEKANVNFMIINTHARRDGQIQINSVHSRWSSSRFLWYCQAMGPTTPGSWWSLRVLDK